MATHLGYCLVRMGLFKNNWLCWCGNTSKKQGFYPCDDKGEYRRDLFGRGKFYACERCGRIIDPKTMNVIGLTKHFKLTPWQLWRHIVCLQAHQDEIKMVGVSYRIILRRLPPRLYRALGEFRPKV